MLPHVPFAFTFLHPNLYPENVMPVRISEFFGYSLGWPLGLILAAGSILRNARFFHPRGLLFCGEIESLPDSPLKLPGNVLVRFSGGWWKFLEWPDALGIAVRMSSTPIKSTGTNSEDIDLLFASFRRPWEMFFSSFMTDHHDYLANSYYAISPFQMTSGRIVDFMISPSRGHRSGGTRDENLLGNVLGGKTILRLMMKERDQETWKMIARILIREESTLDQESLRFHPFHTGHELRPYGFLQYLRQGPYYLSQWVRPGSEIEESELTPERE
jgi:hypothetical protein